MHGTKIDSFTRFTQVTFYARPNELRALVIKLKHGLIPSDFPIGYTEETANASTLELIRYLERQTDNLIFKHAMDARGRPAQLLREPSCQVVLHLTNRRFTLIRTILKGAHLNPAHRPNEEWPHGVARALHNARRNGCVPPPSMSGRYSWVNMSGLGDMTL